MRTNPVRIALLVAVTIVLSDIAAAQFPPPPPPIQQRWPDAEPTLPPSGDTQPPAAAQNPKSTPQLKPALNATVKPKPPAAPGYTLTCGGVFAKDTNHLKLAVKYDSRNIAFTDVDADQTKVKATVLFPHDPKRRLEVLWNNQASRSDVQVISINGQSQWSAPKGLKLGLSLAALEKLNQRPYKLTGFGPDGGASVLDWQGGALSNLPGGCKIGIRFVAERTPESVAIAGDRELLSSDAALKAVKANVVEILLGY